EELESRIGVLGEDDAPGKVEALGELGLSEQDGGRGDRLGGDEVRQMPTGDDVGVGLLDDHVGEMEEALYGVRVTPCVSRGSETGDVVVTDAAVRAAEEILHGEVGQARGVHAVLPAKGGEEVEYVADAGGELEFVRFAADLHGTYEVQKCLRRD